MRMQANLGKTRNSLLSQHEMTCYVVRRTERVDVNGFWLDTVRRIAAPVSSARYECELEMRSLVRR